MASRHRRGNALLAGASVLLTSLLVTSPAAAAPPSCELRTYFDGPMELREGKVWDFRIECGWSGDLLDVSVDRAPEHGVVGGISWDARHREWLVPYTPTAGYAGPDTFVVAVADGAESVEVDVDVLVHPNRTPSCNERDGVFDHLRVGETWSRTLICTDPDYQDYGDLDPTVGVEPEHGTLDLVVAEDQWGSADELTITYTPDPGFVGSERFTAGATDGALVDLVEFYFNVADGPWCSLTDPLEVRAGATVRVLPYCTAPDFAALETTVPTAPQHGTTALVRMAVDYTADPAASGPDSFTIQAVGESGSSNIATQRVTIIPNAAPVCAPVTTTTPRDEPVDVTLSCSDPDGDAIEVGVTGDPSHGTLSPLVDGTVTYVPEDGWDGTDTFTFEARDFARTSGPTTVSVAVTEDDPPRFVLRLADQTPARAARNGLRLLLGLDEAVTADVVVRVPARTARRLDLDHRVIGRLRADAEDLTRWQVPLTRKAARAVRDARRLPLRATVTATDEWGNVATRARRTVLD